MSEYSFSHTHNAPLLYAILSNSVDCVRYMLEHGANPNFANNNWDTPVHVACSQGKVRIVKLLLKHGGDVLIINRSNKNALEYAKEENQYKVIDVIRKFNPKFLEEYSYET